MSDVTSFLRRSGNSNRDDINKLLGLVSNFFFADPEDFALQERITFTNHSRKRTQTLTTPQTADNSESETRERMGILGYRRKIPTAVNTYDLVHATTNTITVPTSDLKYGGGGHGSGTGYITVSDHANLSSNTFTFCCWIYPKATTGDGIIISKNNEYQLKAVNGNLLNFRTYSGGAWRTALSYDFTANINSWISVIATYNSASGHTLYIDNVSVASNGTTGSITGTANDLKILGDGTSNLPTGFKVAWLVMTNAVQDSTWRGNYHSNQLLNFATDTSITIIPFVGDEHVEPIATAGLFEAS